MLTPNALSDSTSGKIVSTLLPLARSSLDLRCELHAPVHRMPSSAAEG
jgi:hypothetical protein